MIEILLKKAMKTSLQKKRKNRAKNTIIMIKSEILKSIKMRKMRLSLSKKSIKMKSQI